MATKSQGATKGKVKQAKGAVKGSKELSVSDTSRLLEAIATGDTSAVDAVQLQELLARLGLKAVAAGVSERRSRIETQRRWLTARQLSEDELRALKELPEKVGRAPVIDAENPRSLSQSEIDEWMDETLVERQVEDILKGRHEARRATFFNMATFESGGDPYATAVYPSTLHGYKFVVTKQERGGDPDYSKLEELVSPDVWHSITDEVTVREVNEEKLAQALSDGRVPLDVFQEVVPAKTVVRVLKVEPLKAGDEVTRRINGQTG